MMTNTPSVNLTDAMLDNFMPYTAYMILHRALPMIDGLKPSQRRVLYTMYNINALPNKPYVKSNTIGGDVMKIHPHGSTYETLVRMTEGHQAFGVPLIDNKGNFGKFYSRDGREAADRYTEARLNKVALELFKGIKLNAVPMRPTYDGQHTEPEVLPVSFPLILTSGISGMAVGMATDIPPFNFHEVIEYTRKVLKGEDTLITDTIKSPDFPFENNIVYDKEKMEEILTTGRGSFKIRAPYEIKDNTVVFKHVPYGAKFEVVREKVSELSQQGKLKEVGKLSSMYGMNSTGLKIVAKRNTDMQLLVEKLYRLTPLESTFSVNLNLVVNNKPQVLGVKEVILEWLKFRKETVRNMTAEQLRMKHKELTRLQGLELIINHLDQVIALVRESSSAEVIQKLQDTFKLKEEQAEYIANMQIRQLTTDNIQKRLEDIQAIVQTIKQLDLLMNDEITLEKFIDSDLARLSKEYSYPRKTSFVDESSIKKIAKKLVKKTEEKKDYNVKVFITEEQYIKKIPLTSMRGKAENRLKDGDKIISDMELTNHGEVLFFTNKHNVHKKRLEDFEDMKLTDLGDYIPTILDLESGEEVLFTIPVAAKFDGSIVLGFSDGNIAVIEDKAYYTKQNRTLLRNGYHKDKELIFAVRNTEDLHITAISTDGLCLVRDIETINPKSSRAVAGNIYMRLNEGEKIKSYNVSSDKEIEKYLIKSAGKGRKLY